MVGFRSSPLSLPLYKQVVCQLFRQSKSLKLLYSVNCISIPVPIDTILLVSERKFKVKLLKLLVFRMVLDNLLFNFL